MSESIYDIAKTIPRTGPNGRGLPNGGTVTEGMSPATNLPNDEGLHWITPEQALAVRIDRVTVTDQGIDGYQRPKCNVQHARRIARMMEAGYPMPPVLLAKNGADGLHATDGQHRLVAAIIADVPIRATVVHMDADEQRRIFSAQGENSRVSPSTIVLTGENPAQRFVQRVCTEREGVWAELVSSDTSNPHFLSPSQAYRAIVGYVLSTVTATGGGPSSNWTGRLEQRWDEDAAEELGRLLRAMGTRRTNPEAFRAHNFRALVGLAVLAVRRNEDRHSQAVKRWGERVPAFPFVDYRHLHREGDVLPVLVQHWNRNLGAHSPYRIT